jgi:4-hydroxy-tetrahydrodipicolinate synthase
MLLVGCDGGTNATTGVAPELLRALYESAVSNRLEEARVKQQQITALFDAMLNTVDFPEGFRAGVKLRGIKLGDGRMPQSDEAKSQIQAASARIEKELRALGLLG